jgi:hypothetical protein
MISVLGINHPGTGDFYFTSCTVTKIPFMYSFSGNSAASGPNFHFHVSVRDLYFLQQNMQTDHGNIEIAHRRINVEIGTETPIFLFWEYLFRYFVFAVCTYDITAQLCK